MITLKRRVFSKVTILAISFATMISFFLTKGLAMASLIWTLFFLLASPQLFGGIGENFVFLPPAFNFHRCPQAQKLDAETLSLKTSGGEKIRLYLQTSEQVGPAGLFIHFHGNGDSACGRLLFMEKLKSSGAPFHVAMIEYPGYSGDPLPPSEKRLLKNALEVYDYLQLKFLNNPSQQIYLYGESLGSTVATYVASRRKVHKLILQAPFPSVVEVGRYFAPFLPVERLMESRFKAEDWAPEVVAPVLIFHGSKDRVIPLKLGKKQSANFERTKVEFIEIKRGGHFNLTEFDNFWQKLFAFLEE